MKKIFFSIVTVLLAVFVIVALSKDFLIKIAIENGVTLVTGLKVQMSSLKVGLIGTDAGMKNLMIYNPSGYPDKVMLDMPEIYVDYDLPSIMKGNIHLTEMRIDLHEFYVVKNYKGELNLDALNLSKGSPEKSAPVQEKGEQKVTGAGKIPEIKIDKLTLKVGKVIYKDYSAGGAASIQEFNINLNEEYRNVDNPYTLVSLIVFKALMNTGIAKLTQFDIGGLQNTLAGALPNGQILAGAAKSILGSTEGALSGLGGGAGSSVNTMANTLKSTASGLTNALKLPFGKASSTTSDTTDTTNQ
ncbi:conserved hypothetical protein, secreted [Candidatus Omnitrophus magneticus]|uniref:AsmA domain-containing protein n=1 Tax=Candidatus Omnitrophus magneticus TaxID=1609969 RepID=A0A0F0CPN2_9BACT|nr:conserved hypothetical protein, secreted [Candidatus Omnitrophus magneticus]